MATVYLAHDVRHSRPVAVKVLSPNLAMAIGADRFHREIQVVARLRHPHIVPLYDSGEADGLLYYVMPYVEGESLRARLVRTGPVPVADAIRYVRDVADALDYAHGEGVIHRDIKPDNVMLDDRHAMLTDFGIARAATGERGATLTQAGLLVGTPAYMSPEQVTGERELDGRSDIFSLGCVFYEMVSGEAPFSGPTLQSVMAKRLAATAPDLPALLDVPPPVGEIITTSLRVNPAERFSDARAMGDALEAAYAATRDPDSITPLRIPPPQRAAPRRVLWVAVIAGVAALSAAIAVIVNRGTPAVPTAAVPNAPLSVGVLPFANPRGNPELEYFSDGVTDELITALSRVEGLQVAGRTSSFSLKGKTVDAMEAARRLQVTHVIDGSIRYDSTTVRVTWQLINGETGRVIGSGEFNGQMRNVIALQDSLARSVVEELRTSLGATAVAAAIPRRQTVDFDAYDLYLKGHYYWNQRTSETMRTGISYLRRAIEKDSTYALAWAELSSALTLQPAFGDAQTGEVRTEARDAASRAVRLDSTLAEAYTALGMSATFNDWDWPAALRYMDRAVALDPQNPFVHLFRAWPLVALNRLDDALGELRRARDLDPLSAIINTRLGTILNYMRRYDEAIAELRKSLEVDPSNVLARFQLARSLMYKNQLDSALKTFPDAIDAESGFATGALGLAYGLAGRPADARKVMARLEARSRQRPIMNEGLALAALGVGDTARAVTYIERAYEDHGLYLVFLRYDPVWDLLRNQPRVQEVLRKARL
jgi:eukaryotic-like serine/threonine-protein kinase